MKIGFVFPFLIAIALANYSHVNNHSLPAEYSELAGYARTTTTIGPAYRNFIPDNYPVTDEMFAGKYGRIQSGAIISQEKAWFRNDELKQSLVFELYTDYHRLLVFHFKNNDIPAELIRRMELLSGDKPACNDAAKKALPGFIHKAQSVDKKYFQSNKGIKLGDSYEKIAKIYGRPDKVSKKSGLETYEWDFVGDKTFDPQKDKGKKIAEGSFGHEAILFFRNHQLIGLILHNEIP